MVLSGDLRIFSISICVYIFVLPLLHSNAPPQQAYRGEGSSWNPKLSIRPKRVCSFHSPFFLTIFSALSLMQNMLDFAYNGKAKVRPTELHSLALLANRVGFSELVDACVEQINPM